MSSIREIVESPIEQGQNEEVQYRILTTPWGGNPSLPTVTLYNNETLTRIPTAMASNIMPANSPTIDGDTITLSPLKALTPGNIYRINVKFTAQGIVWETYFVVIATV